MDGALVFTLKPFWDVICCMFGPEECLDARPQIFLRKMSFHKPE